jgi:hypothetical protein
VSASLRLAFKMTPCILYDRHGFTATCLRSLLVHAFFLHIHYSRRIDSFGPLTMHIAATIGLIYLVVFVQEFHHDAPCAYSVQLRCLAAPSYGIKHDMCAMYSLVAVSCLLDVCTLVDQVAIQGDPAKTEMGHIQVMMDNVGLALQGQPLRNVVDKAKRF